MGCTVGVQVARALQESSRPHAPHTEGGVGGGDDALLRLVDAQLAHPHVARADGHARREPRQQPPPVGRDLVLVAQACKEQRAVAARGDELLPPLAPGGAEDRELLRLQQPGLEHRQLDPDHLRDVAAIDRYEVVAREVVVHPSDGLHLPHRPGAGGVRERERVGEARQQHDGGGRAAAAHRGRQLHGTHAAVAVTRAVEAQVASIAHQQQILLLAVRQGGDRQLAMVKKGR